MGNHDARRYHLIALITASIWGTTFISTKVLLQAGLTPAGIFLIRFSIAYILMWALEPRFHKPQSWRDELLFALAGATGGSFYFLTENTALHITLASNVALIVTTAPILTAIVAHWTVKGERLHKRLWIGAAVAMLGVTFVVFNGKFILKLNPLGDILAFAAAASWAVYSVLIKRFDGKYPMRVVTRRVFFYGILTLLPWFLYEPFTWDWELIKQPTILLNLLFLGVIASSACYVAWNIAIKQIGTIKTNNYIYFIPVVTLFASAWVLDEQLTPLAYLGAALILGGVYLAEKEPTKKR